MNQSLNVVVVGAGAIGGWMGAKLALKGHAVRVLARGATLDGLRERGGLLYRDASGERVVAVGAFDEREIPAQAKPDLIVLAVKAPALASVAPAVGALLGPQTQVLCAMNGVPWWFLEALPKRPDVTHLASIDPNKLLSQTIPAARVLGCVVHASVSAQAGVVQHHFGNGLIMGEARFDDAPSERVQQLVATLSEASFDAKASAQIARDVWFKLWGNMTMNPLSALTGATTDAILGDDLLRGFVSAVMLEAKEIGARIGLPIDQDPADRHAVTLKLGAFKTSMLQDVEAGRAVELDALVSAVRELGQITGVATPMTDALLGLARVQARRLGLY
jgi:2-dehydropantoate 2-reductase